MKLIFMASAALLAGGAIYGATTLDAAPQETAAPKTQPDVIYVPTPPEVVEAMLDVAQVKDGDILYDLGSGDGRIPIAAAKRAKIRATGIDIDPERIAEARANAKAAGVTDEVTFRQEDLFTTDFSDATVVTLYLLNTLNEKLKPRILNELKPGTRIVSHAFSMGDWEPDKELDVNGRRVYFWTVPERGATPAAKKTATE